METPIVTPGLLRTLFQYNLWADLRILNLCSSLTSEQFTRNLGSSFSSVRDTLAHLYGAEWVWNERIEGRFPAALVSGSTFADLKSVAAKLEEMDRFFIAYVSKLTQADLDRVMVYKVFSGQEFSNPLWQSLQQLTNHASYHRGQIVTMLRQLGVKPVSTDLIAYYREQAAAARA
jgi:uncharacterized damage-inducible protein DinB